MITTGQDVDVLGVVSINQTLFIIDAAAPVSGEIASERLGLAKAGVAVALDVFEKVVDFLERFSVLGLPVHIVRPAIVGEAFIHGRRPRAMHAR